VTGEAVSVSESDLELVESGGEADIYKWRYRGEELVVKIFSEKQTLLARPVDRMATMLKRILSLPHCRPLPKCLQHRSFPIGFGSTSDGRAVLVYKALGEFIVFSDVIDDYDKLKQYLNLPLAYRRRMALDVLHGLACFDGAGVVHLDLTTANTALDGIREGCWVHLFDLETACIRGSREYPLVVLPAKDVHFMDSMELSKAGISLRPPSPTELPLAITPGMDPELRSWIEWTYPWYALQLIAYIYTGLSPFHGLPQLSMKYWLEVVEREKRKGFRPLWPPKALMELGYVNESEYRDLRMIWDGLGRLVHIFYKIFVVDVANARSRPSFSLSAIAYYTR